MAGSPDRRPPTPEFYSLQERGGLTPVHWIEVVRRITKPREKVDPQLAQEVCEFAQAESRLTYTLDDYIETGVSGNHDTLPLYSSKFFIGEDDYERRTALHFERYGKIGMWWLTHVQVDIDGFQYAYPEDNEKPTAETILDVYLLDKDSVEDPLHTSPRDLVAILRREARLNPVKIKGRLAKFPHLAHLHDQSYFGLLEEEEIR